MLFLFIIVVPLTASGRHVRELNRLLVGPAQQASLIVVDHRWVMIYHLMLIENVAGQLTQVVFIGRLQRVPDQLKRLLLLVLLRQARFTEELLLRRI